VDRNVKRVGAVRKFDCKKGALKGLGKRKRGLGTKFKRGKDQESPKKVREKQSDSRGGRITGS